MTIKARIKELEARADAERLLRSCTCARLVIIEGEPNARTAAGTRRG